MRLVTHLEGRALRASGDELRLTALRRLRRMMRSLPMSIVRHLAVPG
jgi:hypothetical protein